MNFPGVDFLEWYSERKICLTYLFPPWQMKLGIFMLQSCSDLSKQCTYQNLLLFWHSQCFGRSSLLKLPNYWKISVPFLSQGIIISSLHIREVCPSKMINITVTKIRNLNCTTLTVLKIISITKSRMLKSWSNLGHLIWKRN